MEKDKQKTDDLAIEASRLVRWQVAETAPKDGTYFMSYYVRLEETCCPYEIAHFYESFRNVDGEELDFDFWMPLPSSPNRENTHCE
jgi:hypothetical protein